VSSACALSAAVVQFQMRQELVFGDALGGGTGRKCSIGC
jgi:hypothetical protein